MVIRRPARGTPAPPRPPAPAAGPARWPVPAACAALALAAAVAYAGAFGAEFVGYDDPEYVTENPSVLAGLSADGVAWAFTTFHASNWHPLVWVSLQLDATAFGPGPAGFHFTNVALHAANAVLLFLALRRATGRAGAAWVVAGLFALHPLHVESVAWVTERKDVLCGFGWLLTVLAYVWYAEAPGAGRYAAVVAAYALAVLAKPMAVTLPFALLLLDYWPLGRVRAAVPPAAGPGRGPAGLGRLVAEKLPLLAMSAACCVLTWKAQSSETAIKALADYPLGLRVANAAVSYADYLRQAAAPTGLAVHYAYPTAGLPAWRVAAAGLLLAAVTAVALRTATARPYLVVGWFWFLGTLVPAIGLVQVGSQARADRYTYLPLVGVYAAAVWGAADLAGRLGWRAGLAPLAGVALLGCGFATAAQVGHWKDEVRLWAHAARVEPQNLTALRNLGLALMKRGRALEAVPPYRAVLALAPDAEGHNNLGGALAASGQFAAAGDHFREALRLRPDDPAARQNLDQLRRLTGGPP